MLHHRRRDQDPATKPRVSTPSDHISTKTSRASNDTRQSVRHKRDITMAEVATGTAVDGAVVNHLEQLVLENARKTKAIYSSTTDSASGRKRLKLDPASASRSEERRVGKECPV